MWRWRRGKKRDAADRTSMPVSERRWNGGGGGEEEEEEEEEGEGEGGRNRGNMRFAYVMAHPLPEAA